MPTASKSRHAWTKESTHPLEYRATINGATCVLRVHDGEWTASIRRGAAPFETTKHATYWHARDYCEAHA